MLRLQRGFAISPSTLLESLAEHARTRASAPALVEQDRTVDHVELARLVAAGAARFGRAGVRPGDRVLLQGPNSVALAVAYFSAHAAGGIAVPVDPDLSPESLRAVVEACAPTVVARDGAVAHAGDPPVVALADFATGPSSAGELRARPAPEDGADILFTTGTSGRPKGVLLTHANVAAAARNIVAFMGQGPSDVELVPVPFSHSFGLGRLRCMAVAGNAVVPLQGLRFPARLADAITRHRATGLALVPAGLALLRKHLPDGVPALGALRYVELASAPIARDVRAWALEQMPGTRIIHTYGLTEASRSAYVELASEETTRGSIGVPSSNVEIELRDEAGGPTPAGAEGELWIRGPHVMREYWGRPDATEAALRGGWLRTGDLATRAETGSFHLTGRASDMINVGGMKVAPAEVERLLLEHADVVDAACVGVPDPNGVSGQRVKAFVTSAAELRPAALVAWLRERGLEAYKVPIAVEQRASIPRTASGKLLRRLL